MKLALVYYQEQENLNTQEILQELKEKFKKEKWELSGLFIDKINEYENLMVMITEELSEVDVIFLYSKNNIKDEFFWNLLCQTAKIENVLIKEFLD
ncbi:hypothetical protein MOB40_11765 [Bacillus inaquosorum]|uniref:hypothetical protein n=1 Tax=Bacillus subtilis group TaxID=653685 RepID=UPI000D039F2B|nr:MULTISPECIES: hypothetical protein [Bacillus subtilis group]MCY7905578.1 hypothetical protein [Bacillus inaquosorum]MCY7929479.1 hypothetical protein [Bacillus inaquosorum]MCY8768536.1 hypothetical protein [Bacillus inaquosorum]MCY9049677.1 hypothetical protein [Bacillus inaquosorum]MEC2133651.1 hypothetical protein [Bacillus subtilis]